MSEELGLLREAIDGIDAELLELVSRRAEHARRIGEVKQGAPYRPEREAQVLQRMIELNRGPLDSETIGRIFREIMSACLALEQPLRIAYFGPAGTFTESAARKHFGSAPEFSPLAAIDEVFRAVEATNADYGVVPVENSTEGAVGRTLDLLLAAPLAICGEVVLRVHPPLARQGHEAGVGAAALLARPIAGSVSRVAQPQSRGCAARAGREQRRSGAPGSAGCDSVRDRRRRRR